MNETMKYGLKCSNVIRQVVESGEIYLDANSSNRSCNILHFSIWKWSMDPLNCSMTKLNLIILNNDSLVSSNVANKIMYGENDRDLSSSFAVTMKIKTYVHIKANKYHRKFRTKNTLDWNLKLFHRIEAKNPLTPYSKNVSSYFMKIKFSDRKKVAIRIWKQQFESFTKFQWFFCCRNSKSDNYQFWRL